MTYVNQSQVIDEIAEVGLKRRRIIEVRIMSGAWYLSYLSRSLTSTLPQHRLPW
jgi:hypothetical protein